MKHRRRSLYVPLIGFVAVLGLACGSSSDSYKELLDPSKASLSGKITYKGKPFPGYILVESETNGSTARGVFAQDGSYIIANAPIGKMKLRLLSPPPRRRGPPKGQDPAAEPALVPPKYGDPQQSGLTVELHPGRNEFSMDLQ